MTKFKASGLAMIGGISYGFLPSFTKMAYAAGVSTGSLVALQNLVGGLLLWSLAVIMRKQDMKITKRQSIKLLLTGTLSGSTGAFYYLALSHLPSALAIVLLFQFTWISGLLECIIERRTPQRRQLLALALLIPGTLLAVGFGQIKLSQFGWQGLCFGLLSALTYSGLLYSTGRVATEVSPWLRSATIVSGSFLINLLLFPPTYLTGPFFSDSLLLWGTLMGIFGPVIPIVCFTFGVPVIGGGMAAILGAIELPVVVTVAYFILGEAVTWLQWLGVAIILAGIYLGEKFDLDAKGVMRNALNE